MGRWLTSFCNVSAIFKETATASSQVCVLVCVCVCGRLAWVSCECAQLNVCRRVTELNYHCRELAPRSRLDGILCDFCRILISFRLVHTRALSHTHTRRTLGYTGICVQLLNVVVYLVWVEMLLLSVVFAFNFVWITEIRGFPAFKIAIKVLQAIAT